MKDAELQKLPAKELRELRDRVDQAISVVTQREKSELKAKLIAMAAEHGMSLADFASGRKVKTGNAAVVKYRNPKNAEQTWSGRGRKPNWLVKLGGDPERFRIG